jgi:hypothetical protein
MNKKLIVGLLVPALMAIAPIGVVQASPAKPNVLEKIFKKIQYTASRTLSLKALGYTKSRKIAGGKRGCSVPAEKVGENLMAIVPNDVGLTSSAKPMVWLYSPYQKSQKEGILKGSLVLRKLSTVNNKLEEKQVGREISFNIPTTPSTFSVQVEEELQKGSIYKWVVTVQCDKDAAANPTTGGFIAFDQSIQSKPLTNEEDKLVAAAEQGYWYDILNTLLKSDSQQQLDEFLKSGEASVESQRILKR